MTDAVVPRRTTHTVDAPGAVLTYDVYLPSGPDGRRPLFIFGSPMGASGFGDLVSALADRTLITYDPRGAERSELLSNGEVTAELHGEDMHRVIEAAGLGQVNAFGSSGGGAFALHWIVQHPDDVHVLVSHEPPLTTILDDREIAISATSDVVQTYDREGYGPAMAKFIQLVMHEGPLTDDYLDRPAPNPAQFGLPTEDDGARHDALLSRNLRIAPFEPDLAALRSSPVRIVPAVGIQGGGTLARRGGEALASQLGMDPVVFPGDHTGFSPGPMSPGNDPNAFATQLTDLLDD